MPMDKVAEFRSRALTPEHPVARGMAENPETFFAHREVCNPYYDSVPAAVEKYMAEISKITGREYKLFSYYGADDAERVIICMGSVTEAAREAIDYLNAKGEKVGMVSVHLYRPRLSTSLQLCPRLASASLCSTALRNPAPTANLSTST